MCAPVVLVRPAAVYIEVPFSDYTVIVLFRVLFADGKTKLWKLK
jgi:hypothetical protein